MPLVVAISARARSAEAVAAGVALIFPLVALGAVFKADHHTFEAERGLWVALCRRKDYQSWT